MPTVRVRETYIGKDYPPNPANFAIWFDTNENPAILRLRFQGKWHTQASIQIMLDMDQDQKADKILAFNDPVIVTEDDDSINIDRDSDLVADTVVPK